MSARRRPLVLESVKPWWGAVLGTENPGPEETLYLREGNNDGGRGKSGHGRFGSLLGPGLNARV
jgi:hypothetical protein